MLILGAGSDIGLAVAHHFAKNQYPIQLAARRPEELEPTRRDIVLRYSVVVTTHRLDVLEIDSVDHFFDELPTLPAVVISLVGLLGDQAQTETDPSRARAIVDTNFLGPTIALGVAARRLAKLDEETAIIGVSSVAGDRGRAKNYWYGASKAGFTAALSGLRQQYARTHLRVITVKPGFVSTRMTEGMNLPQWLTATPDQIAELIYSAHIKRSRVAIPWRWRLVMVIVAALPEVIFERLRF